MIGYRQASSDYERSLEFPYDRVVYSEEYLEELERLKEEAEYREYLRRLDK